MNKIEKYATRWESNPRPFAWELSTISTGPVGPHDRDIRLYSDLYAIHSFFTWILRISFVVFSVPSVVLTWFIRDTSVKISRKDPNSSQFSHVYPRVSM